jgi:hypothetical protein
LLEGPNGDLAVAAAEEAPGDDGDWDVLTVVVDAAGKPGRLRSHGPVEGGQFASIHLFRRGGGLWLARPTPGSGLSLHCLACVEEPAAQPIHVPGGSIVTGVEPLGGQHLLVATRGATSTTTTTLSVTHHVLNSGKQTGHTELEVRDSGPGYATVACTAEGTCAVAWGTRSEPRLARVWTAAIGPDLALLRAPAPVADLGDRPLAFPRIAPRPGGFYLAWRDVREGTVFGQLLDAQAGPLSTPCELTRGAQDPGAEDMDLVATADGHGFFYWQSPEEHQRALILHRAW